MGNGARAQQKRERNADKGAKGPSSQLKAVSFPLSWFISLEYHRCVILSLLSALCCLGGDLV